MLPDLDGGPCGARDGDVVRGRRAARGTAGGDRVPGRAYTASVPRPDPFLAASLLVVDGRNVLGAMRRAGGDLPAQALLSRLWTVVGPRTRILVVFDGVRDGGAIVPERSSRLGVRWSRLESADDLIVRIAADGPEQTVVVTDDIELGTRVRALGATSFRSRALLERFARQRQTAPGVGHGRPPAAAPSAGGRGPAGKGDEDPEREAWKPGRGATKKSGNPKRGRPPA
jgi:hypothetical protein